jgi:hypothetical protein
VERKESLATDNGLSYPKKEKLKSGEIRVIFLPPIITSLCQPMGQGVTETPKKTY